ncbi:MAG: DUF4404 family protein [Gemmatimonadota bacterium]|nr:DUF4404 family protein [Gemmatimonadota bacterium]MDE3129205.1 DUF4404 family protein [Gemmatimonadota bacterium]MDE3172868.1 DUF4404 family protein [Gemmatimonadota bacterium]MDE3215965.1 DUF4404 family protein [Gemmatimonadota bacterium]
MNERDLHGLLTDLHHKLQHPAPPVDGATKSVLDQLSADIHPIIEGGPGGPIAGGKAAGLRERLNAAMAAVEVSHPELAGAIERVADTLAFYNL